MINLGEIIAISFPPLYFVYSHITKMLEMGHSGLEVSEILLPDSKDKYISIALARFKRELYWDFLITSIINGIHLILILQLSEIGVLVIIFGIGLSIYGHHCLSLENEYSRVYSGKNLSEGEDVTGKITKTMLSFSLGIIGFYLFFNNTFQIQNIYFVKYVVALIMFILVYRTSPFILKFLPGYSTFVDK